MALTINLEEQHNHILLEIIGSVDSTHAKIISQAMDSVIAGSQKHLLLDCTQMQNITSEGLKVILHARRQMAYFRMMMFCNPSSSIGALLELSGITTFVPAVADLTEAETLLQELDFAQGNVAEHPPYGSFDPWGH